MKKLLVEQKLLSELTMGTYIGFYYYFDDTEDIINYVNSKFKSKHINITHNNTNIDVKIQKLPITPENIQKLIYLVEEMLNFATDGKIHTFEQSIGYDDFSAEDVVWVTCQLSNDLSAQKLLKSFTDKMLTVYSSYDPEMHNLSKIYDCIQESDYQSLVNEIFKPRYSLFNIPYLKDNAINWRIDSISFNNQGIDIIKPFYKSFLQFSKWFINALESKELEDMSKENFMEQIKPYLKNKDTSHFKKEKIKGEISKETLDKIIKGVRSNPKSILKYDDKTIDKIFEELEKLSYTNIPVLLSDLKSVMPMEDFKNVINIAYKNALGWVIDNYEKYLDIETIESTTGEMLYRELGRYGKQISSDVTIYNILRLQHYKLYDVNVLGSAKDNFDKWFEYILQNSGRCSMDDTLEYLKYCKEHKLKFRKSISTYIKPLVERLFSARYKPIILSEKIKEFYSYMEDSDELILNTIRKEFRKELFKNPQNVIEFMNFNEQSLYYTLNYFYHIYGRDRFNNEIAPLFIKYGKARQEDIDDVVKTNNDYSNYKHLTLIDDEIEYDEDEIN